MEEIKEIEVTQTDENSINLQERFVDEADFIKIKKWGFWLHIVFFATPWFFLFILFVLGFLFGDNEATNEFIKSKISPGTGINFQYILTSIMTLWVMLSIFLTPFLSLSLFKFIDAKCNTKSYDYALKAIKYFFGLAIVAGLFLIFTRTVLDISFIGVNAWMLPIFVLIYIVILTIIVYSNVYKAFNELAIVSGIGSFRIFVVLWIIGNFIIFVFFIAPIFLVYAWLNVKQLKILPAYRFVDKRPDV